MKFGSVLKLSVHNLWQNKLRSALTILVLFIVSTLIVTLAGFVVNFYESTTININDAFQKSGTVFSVSNHHKAEGGSTYGQEKEISVADAKKIIAGLEGEDIFSTIEVLAGWGGNSSVYICEKDAEGNWNKGNWMTVAPYYAKSNPFIGWGDYLAQGRMWNASDDGRANIWLPTSYMSDYKLGDQMYLNIGSSGEPTLFTIQGFLSKGNSNGNGCFVDMSFFNGIAPIDRYSGGGSSSNESLMANLYIGNVRARFIPQEGKTYGIGTQNKLVALEKEWNTFKKDSGGFQVYDHFLDNTKMARLMFLVLLGVVAFFSVIIILLSIGSVANTIKITVEQNRRFFGMMKAIGMKNKTVRAVVNWQAVLMTLISVGVATLVSFFILMGTESLLVQLIKMMFGAEKVVCTMSPFVPIVVFTVLVGFVLLFTRKSLMSISKMDVISVISEVN